jgi:hypothetical protein
MEPFVLDLETMELGPWACLRSRLSIVGCYWLRKGYLCGWRVELCFLLLSVVFVAGDNKHRSNPSGLLTSICCFAAMNRKHLETCSL